MVYTQYFTKHPRLAVSAEGVSKTKQADGDDPRGPENYVNRIDGEVSLSAAVNAEITA